MTSLGSSALRYMTRLKPALDERGYDLAVFHATGMGGLAFESLVARGAFACAFDLCTQELGNHVHGSRVSAGLERLAAATGPTALLLPPSGTGEWDRPGAELHLPVELAAFVGPPAASADLAAGRAGEDVAQHAVASVQSSRRAARPSPPASAASGSGRHVKAMIAGPAVRRARTRGDVAASAS